MEQTKSSGNVFTDMGFDPEEAAVMKIKAELRIAIEKEIKLRRLSQAKAAEIVGTTRPALNRILNGKLDKLSIDKMVQMNHRLGKRVTVKVTKAKAA
jgi:predicted XRE-type DNA-binding protein